LDAVRAVIDPATTRLNELARRDHGCMTKDGYEITRAASFVEGHSVDRTGQGPQSSSLSSSPSRALYGSVQRCATPVDRGAALYQSEE
jgi:hypothetical protein